MERYYLGFDAGTQSVRVAVYDADMNCVAQAANATSFTFPGPGLVEMSADGYLELTVKGIRQCTDAMVAEGRDPRAIRAVMGDGILSGVVWVDADVHAITPCISYLDSRAQGVADRINAMRLDIWGKEAGNIGAACVFTTVMDRWILENADRYPAGGRKFVHICPYILMNLAGLGADDAFIDHGTLTGCGLGYDMMNLEWSDRQLEILGVDRECLPRIAKPWEIVGRITPEMAERTGLAPGTPVCAGAGDTMQSGLGCCGAIGTGTALDIAGTCSMFCVPVDGIDPRITFGSTDLAFARGSLEGSFFYAGYIRTGGMALSWFKDTVCAGTVDYTSLSAGAAQVPPGSNGVTFLPYLTGGNGALAGASGAFLNLTPDTDIGILWRSVMEAVGYEYMGMADRFRAAGIPMERMFVAEGGSASDFWNGMKADMLGIPVSVAERGGALLADCVMAAYAVGDVPDLEKALRDAVTVGRTYRPDPDVTAVYRRQAEGRAAVLEGMSKGVFDALAGMRVR